MALKNLANDAAPMLEPDIANHLGESSDALSVSIQVAQLLHGDDKYPRAPRLIERAWQALVPAIEELSYHHSNASHTIIQTIRRSAKPYGRRRLRNIEPVNHALVDQMAGWFHDLLILTGTLPIESSEIGDRAHRLGLARYLEPEAKLPINTADAAVSAQSRAEAMSCLDLLCAKAWYGRNKEKLGIIPLRVNLFRALQYFYWECGMPLSITLMTDIPPELNDSIYEQVRVLNYRQLYALHNAGRVQMLFDSVERGIEHLRERRLSHVTQFDAALVRDVRWGIDFSEFSERISAKYRVSEDDVEGELVDTELSE